MSRENLLFHVKWWLLILLSINLTSYVHSAKFNNDEKISTELFTNNFFYTHGEYVRIISVTKHMGLSLERMIHLPRDQNSIKNQRVLFNYILSGFKFFDDIIKSNDVDVKLMDKLLLTSKYNQTTIIFYQIIKDIETIFDSKFVNILKSYDGNITEDINSFLNDTVSDPNFRNSIRLTDFCHSPNKVDLMTNGKTTKNIFHMYFESLQSNVSD